MSPDQQTAIAAARTVLRDAVRYHESFGGGFEYRGREASFTVTADAYAALLTNLRSLNFDADASMRKEAFAAYNQRGDIVKLRKENLSHPAFRPALLHELVHAYQDFSRFRGRHWEIEATAYMAQALWTAADLSSDARNIRRRLEAMTHVPASRRTSNTPIAIEAAQACLTLGLDQGVVAIDRTHLSRLEQALRESEAYKDHVDTSFTGDGFNNRR